MATVLTPLVVKRNALTALGSPSAGDPTGMTFPNGGKSLVYIANGSTERAITIDYARGVDGAVPNPKSVVVPANFEGLMGIGSVSDYGAVAKITPSHAEVTVKVVQVEG